jgi:ABC-type sugar transport system ATPase subunit
VSAFLELSALRKVFPDGTVAVDGMDLSCAEGEFVVLLGPSGCGKTTTLRMVAGLEAPSSGSIRMAGEEIAQLPPQARDVGFVFQFYALYPHLSVFDNVAFPLRSVGCDVVQVRQRVGEMVERLGLEHLVGRRPATLSGGDQQRVALARALVRSPRLWLMDEPLGTLDGEGRLQMRELIRRQQIDLGITTIYVTHDQEEAMSLADRVVVMEGGDIRQIGPPGEVYDDPQDLFVADFVGSPSMNIVTGQSTAAGLLLTPCGVQLPLSRPVAALLPLALGVRPEAVFVDDQGPLAGTVVLDELLGAHRNIHVDTSVGRFIMRRHPTEGLATGTAVTLGFDPRRTCLFRTDTGKSIR